MQKGWAFSQSTEYNFNMFRCDGVVHMKRVWWFWMGVRCRAVKNRLCGTSWTIPNSGSFISLNSTLCFFLIIWMTKLVSRCLFSSIYSNHFLDALFSFLVGICFAATISLFCSHFHNTVLHAALSLYVVPIQVCLCVRCCCHFAHTLYSEWRWCMISEWKVLKRVKVLCGKRA